MTSDLSSAGSSCSESPTVCVSSSSSSVVCPRLQQERERWCSTPWPWTHKPAGESGDDINSLAHCEFTALFTIGHYTVFKARSWQVNVQLLLSSHLSAGLGAYESCDGAEVIVVSPDENPKQRSFSPAPIHRLSLTGQLHLHRSLAAWVSLCKNKQYNTLYHLYYYTYT